jgi:valyl-tRNA synthetase
MPSAVPDAPLETRWIVSELHSTADMVNHSLDNYRFDDAANIIYQFFWGSFCDWYIEIVKLRLDFSASADKTQTEAALTTLVFVFETALRLLSPFMPFLTDELWHAVYGGNPPVKSIALVRYPQAVDFPFNAHSVLGMNRIRDLVGNVLARRKELGVAEKEATPILAVWDAGSSVGSTKPEINNVYRENEDMVLRMAHVSLIESKDLQYLESTPELGWTQAGGPFISVVYERTIDVAAERERLTKEIAKYEKQNANDERQLSDPAFLAKAPAHIVEGKKKQLAENRLLLEKARAALDALPEE